jgi:transcriptional regulator with XRE-family HTH domain
MYEEDFAPRLTALRYKKGVSAREMSLSIGQNPGYIHNIECGKALPSMSAFFFICDFLEITPKEFFDTDNSQPEMIRQLTKNLIKLDDECLHALAILVERLAK